MQDKELDDLFRNKFEEAEMAPSSDLWGAIAQGLKVKPKKRVLPVYWMAAALVVAGLSAGLLFRTANRQPVVESEVVNTPTHVISDMAEAKIESAQGTTRTAVDGTEKSDGITRGEQGRQEESLSGRVSAGKTALAGTPGAAGKTALISIKSIAVNGSANSAQTKAQLAGNTILSGSAKLNQSTDFALNGADAKKDLVAVQPSGLKTHPHTTSIAVIQGKVNLPKGVEPPVEEIVLANNTGSAVARDEVSNENEETPGRGIRNMGDLVNYVVDKIDKREEKVLQFKTEDDNSSLVALNIGVFKFNQKKHK